MRQTDIGTALVWAIDLRSHKDGIFPQNRTGTTNSNKIRHPKYTSIYIDLRGSS